MKNGIRNAPWLWKEGKRERVSRGKPTIESSEQNKKTSCDLVSLWRVGAVKKGKTEDA